ncbi:MAG TPA: DUF4198 domain-containing protein, partial [Luteitalea sp.]|nr:DUF4198 domain-containing protein [Luteitalea sp.]
LSFALSLCGVLTAHDLFLRPDAFHLAPGAPISIGVLSGTFSTSENAITTDRLADLSLVTTNGRTPVDRSHWTQVEPRSTLTVAGQPRGTYVIGAALHPRLLSLPAAEFNAYLAEEGLDRVLARRRQQGRLQEDSQERYVKFVKALVQVGDTPTDVHAALLGYRAELVPLDNPYRLKAGDVLRLRCLIDGAPAPAGHVLFAGGRTPDGRRFRPQRVVTDDKGDVSVRLTTAGAWYVKLVAMHEVSEPGVRYESLWSTVTFGVR